MGEAPSLSAVPACTWLYSPNPNPNPDPNPNPEPNPNPNPNQVPSLTDLDRSAHPVSNELLYANEDISGSGSDHSSPHARPEGKRTIFKVDA